MGYYIVHLDGDSGLEATSPCEVASAGLRGGLLGVAAGGKHVAALAAGDLVLVYVGPPVEEFIGCAAVTGPVRDLSAAETRPVSGQPAVGVQLSDVEEWEPPVSMADVLRCIDPARGAKADIPSGLVRITEPEYQGALLAASQRGAGPASDE